MLPNTSKIKGNQTLKFGQLIEYNVRNTLFIFIFILEGGSCTLQFNFASTSF